MTKRLQRQPSVCYRADHNGKLEFAVRARGIALGLTMAMAFAVSGCGTTGKPIFGAAKPAEKPGQQVLAAAKVKNGGILGAGIAGRLDEKALKSALDAEFQALEFSNPGAPVPWTSGASRGEVNAAQPYQVGSQNCRAYTHTVFASASPQTARGTACRNPDGTWTPLT